MLLQHLPEPHHKMIQHSEMHCRKRCAEIRARNIQFYEIVSRIQLPAMDGASMRVQSIRTYYRK